MKRLAAALLFALTLSAEELYVSNERDGTVQIIDTKSDRVIATTRVGNRPRGMVLAPGGQRLYDAKTQKVAANILVDARPRVALFTRDSKKAWISAEIGGTAMLVDVPTQRVVKRIRLRPNDKPVGLALSPDERRLYVATGRGNAVA